MFDYPEVGADRPVFRAEELGLTARWRGRAGLRVQCLPAPPTFCGGGDPGWSSFGLVNSVTVPGSLTPWLTAHKLPALSKVTPCGRKKLVLETVTMGVGEPGLASSFFAYSTTAWPTGPGLNRMFPDVLKAMPSAPALLIVSTSRPEMLTFLGLSLEPPGPSPGN